MTRSFVVSGARVTYRSATLDDLEAAAHADPTTRLHELVSRTSVGEAVVLQTCNRVEEYVVAETATAGRDALSDFAPGLPADVAIETGHRESLEHLLRVAAGLESQVLGEDQVLGQVRDAYVAAQDADTLGPILESAMVKAIRVGERARTETGINEGVVSLGSAAVELVRQERGLDGDIVVVGAGDTARTVVRSLADRGVDRMSILNRSPENARRIADDYALSARCDGLDALPVALGRADVVLTATGSDERVVRPGTVSGNEDLLIVDLARPRDVDPAVEDVNGVTVRDLDALRAVTDATHRERREAAVAVESIVDEEFDRLIDQYKRARADAVIAAMYRGAERIKQREVSEALAKLDATDLSEADREAIEGLADAIVSQLMAVPTESLRDAAAEDDWETIATAIELFDPGQGTEGPDLFEAIAEGTSLEAAAEAADDS